MSRSKFRVGGRLDKAGGFAEGTVTIDRESGTFEVRPLRARGERVYVLPLATVADMVVSRLVKTRVMLARFEKAKARTAKRGAPRRRRVG